MEDQRILALVFGPRSPVNLKRRSSHHFLENAQFYFLNSFRYWP